MLRNLKRGFTYVELMVAITLMALVTAAVFSTVRFCASRFQLQMKNIVDTSQDAILRALLRRDLRMASDPTDQVPFVGRSYEFHFFKSGTRPESLVELTYRLTDHECIRDENKQSTRFPLNKINAHFDYFDGQTWTSDWGWNNGTAQVAQGIRGLPVAVRLTASKEKFIFPLLVAVLNRGLQ